MTRKKTPTKDSVLLEALRSNLNLLGEIAMSYEVETQPEAPEDPPAINCPEDVRLLLGPEMAPLAQKQIRVLLLNARNLVVGQRVIFQGNVNSSVVRLAEVLRPRRRRGRSPASSSATTTQARTRRPARRTRPSPESWSRRASCWASSCWTTSSSAGRGSSASRSGA